MDSEKLLFIYASTYRHLTAEHLHAYINNNTCRENHLVAGKRVEKIIRRKTYRDIARRILDHSSSLGVEVITYLDSSYPDKVRSAGFAPPVLYLKGDKSSLQGFTGSVVGSRKPTASGMRFCTDLAREMAMNDIVVLSGFARGIDSCAHRGALEGNGRTVAVFGSGVDVIYPRENGMLYDAVLESGCILSRFPPGTPPHGKNFPVRNSIIAALSDFVCVVEATGRSGSLITARFGVEYGKEIFSVPGNPLFPQSEGTNGLIKHGAHPLTSLADIYETFGLSYTGPKRKAQEIGVELTDVERRLLDSFRGEMTLDEIADLAGLDVKEVSPNLITLQLKNLVARGEDGYFFKIG